jgi:hypothetical protein
MKLVILAAVVLSAISVEAFLRYRRFGFAAVRLKMLYSLFLLSREAVEAINEINQRVARAGERSFDRLFALYAAASGRPVEEIRVLFGFDIPLRALNGSRFALRNRLLWHIGVVPLPAQRLRTLTTTAMGTRTVSSDLDASARGEPVKRVILTGGSAAFGFGATRDSATIGSRLEYHLNTRDARGEYRWQVENHAVPGATSFQELILILQRIDPAAPPDYVVSLSGWNDVYHHFYSGQPNVSALAQGHTESLEKDGVLVHALRHLRARSVLVSAVQRFIEAYEAWSPDMKGTSTGEEGRRRSSDRVDGPDIYPLW